jgi:hypothetical protein
MIWAFDDPANPSVDLRRGRATSVPGEHARHFDFAAVGAVWPFRSGPFGPAPDQSRDLSTSPTTAVPPTQRRVHLGLRRPLIASFRSSSTGPPNDTIAKGREDSRVAAQVSACALSDQVLP